MPDTSKDTTPSGPPSITRKITPPGSKPSRGPDGYYRLTPHIGASPSQVDSTPASTPPNPINTSQPPPPISDERNTPRPTTQKAPPVAREGSGRGASGATLNNPVISQPAVSSFGSIQFVHRGAQQTGEATPSIKLRVGSAQTGGGRENGAGAGKGEASGTR